MKLKTIKNLKLKVRNIVQLVTQCVVFALLFCPGVYKEYSFSNDTFWGKYEDVYDDRHIAVMFLAFLTITLLAFILQIIEKTNKKYTLIFIPLQAVFFAIYSAHYYYVGIAFYVIELVLVGLFAFTLLTIKCGDDYTAEDEKQAVGNSAASAIAEFKKLLDMGAITQEEFEKKKEELLKR